MSRVTAVFLFAFLTIGVLTASACLDSFLLPNTDAEGNPIPGSSPASAAGSILSLFVPWAGTALGAVGSIYGDIRRRQYRKALKSVSRGINAYRSSQGADWKAKIGPLFEILQAEQERDGARQIVRKVVHEVENGK